jgi:putative hydrolase of the HAD superfamily
VTPGPYAAVVFDLDDTLIGEEGAARRSLRIAAGLMPDHDPDRVVEVTLGTARRIWRGSPYHAVALDLGISSWEALWSSLEGGHPVLDGLREWSRTYSTRVWEETVRELGGAGAEVAGRLDRAYREAQWDAHVAFEGVPGLLSDLRRHLRIGLLTNGPPDIQRRKLVHAGLVDAFDGVVISGEAGVGKPRREVFDLVRGALRAEGPVLMVGDSWERDVMGAIGAGWPAAWVAHGRPVPAGSCVPVAVVERVTDLRHRLFEPKT